MRGGNATDLAALEEELAKEDANKCKDFVANFLEKQQLSHMRQM